jgi:hypothetical protein
MQAVPPSDNPNGTVQLHQVISTKQVVHTELSLRLTFQLRHSLEGYTVGTTAGFPIETVEALAPRSHHLIPRRRPQ